MATCLEKHPDKDIVEFWSEDHLRGLRWQAVANFCQAVPSFNFVDFVCYFVNDNVQCMNIKNSIILELCCSLYIWLLQLSNITIYNFHGQSSCVLVSVNGNGNLHNDDVIRISLTGTADPRHVAESLEHEQLYVSIHTQFKCRQKQETYTISVGRILSTYSCKHFGADVF